MKFRSRSSVAFLILVAVAAIDLTPMGATAQSIPSLFAADAYALNPDQVRLVVDGQDLDGDAVGLRHQGFVSGLPVTSQIDQPFDDPVIGITGPFTAAVTVSGLFGLGVTDFSVQIYDAQSLLSTPLSIGAVPLPMRGLGEACDPLELRDLCSPGLSCLSDGSGGYACAEAAQVPALSLPAGAALLGTMLILGFLFLRTSRYA